jgi:hypothetical protein
MPAMAGRRSRQRTARKPISWVFDGYLMGCAFSVGLPPRESLDKMTQNQTQFVKGGLGLKRNKRIKILIFKVFAFDTNSVESTSVCSLDWSFIPA